MSKFKVGDRVRRVARPFDWCPLGFETTVAREPSCGGNIVWYVANNGSELNGDPSNWELVSSGPVRTTTRTITETEIVEGVFGPLHIVPHEKGTVLVGFVHPADQQFSSLTAPELTAAIETLTAVRDAMVSNG